MLNLIRRFLPTREPRLRCPDCRSVGTIRHRVNLVAFPVGPFALTTQRQQSITTAHVYTCDTKGCLFAVTTLPVVKL